MDYRELDVEKEKQLYNHRLIHDYSDYNDKAYVGRYGELITIYWIEESKHWVFNNQTAGLFDVYINDDSAIHKLLMHYCLKGNQDFNYKKNRLSRTMYLNNFIHKIYDKYVNTKDNKLLTIIERTIKDLEIFKLNKTHFKDWIIAGAHRGLDEVPKEEIQFFLKMRKKAKKQKKLSYKEELEDYLNFIDECREELIEE